MNYLADIIKQLNALSQTSRNEIVRSILSYNGKNEAETELSNEVESVRFRSRQVCPYYEQEHVVRNGKRKDSSQKYKCKKFKRSFVASASCVLYRSHKGIATWHIESFLLKYSIKESTIRCGISRKTLFLRNHKILQFLSMMEDKVELQGAV